MCVYVCGCACNLHSETLHQREIGINTFCSVICHIFTRLKPSEHQSILLWRHLSNCPTLQRHTHAHTWTHTTTHKYTQSQAQTQTGCAHIQAFVKTVTQTFCPLPNLQYSLGKHNIHTSQLYCCVWTEHQLHNVRQQLCFEDLKFSLFIRISPFRMVFKNRADLV